MIECGEIVSRLLSKKRHVEEDGSASIEAFLLRENETGLSVYRNGILNEAQREGKLSKVYGQATLHVGCIRLISPAEGEYLDVIDDQVINGEGHASVINLPQAVGDHISEEHVTAAERVASLLRQKSRKLL